MRGGREKLPTIAIIAHYDTLSIVPELTKGIDTNGSGAVALLELARLFDILYSDTKTKGNYNFVFVLTGGGRLNYEGAKYWLDKLDHQILDNLEFVLCLEALAGEHLYLHISQKTTDEKIIRLYKVRTFF